MAAIKKSTNSPILPRKLTTFLLLILYILLAFLIPPLYCALFLAYVLYPVVHFFSKTLKLPYFLSALLTSILFLFTIFLFCSFIVHSFTTTFPNIASLLIEFSQRQELPLFIPQILEQSLAMLDQLLYYISHSLQTIIDYILQLFIFLMAFIFSLLESKKNRLWFFAYVPVFCRTQWTQYFTKAMKLFSYFLFVEFQLFVLCFVLLAIGFSLLQFDAAISKAFLIALADCLPFFGIGLILMPLAIYFTIMQNYILAIAITTLYIFIQVSRQLADSRLWASTFHIRTIHTFFISASSILIFGVYGIFLSPFLLLLAVKLKEGAIFDR